MKETCEACQKPAPPAAAALGRRAFGRVLCGGCRERERKAHNFKFTDHPRNGAESGYEARCSHCGELRVNRSGQRYDQPDDHCTATEPDEERPFWWEEPWAELAAEHLLPALPLR